MKNKTKPPFSPTFSAAKFRALLEAEKLKEGGGVTCYRLAKDACYASPNAVYHHRDGRATPSTLVIKSYAASLDVPVEALYEDEKNDENISAEA